MDFAKPSCKYDVGDLIAFNNSDFLVVEIQSKLVTENIVIYKLMRLGTSKTASWFATDVDRNSRLLS